MSDVIASRSEALRKVFSAYLRRLMAEKRLNQSDLARIVWPGQNRTDAKGYEQPMGKDRISAYYRGAVMPTSVNLNKIAAALEVTPEEMLGISPEAMLGESDELSMPTIRILATAQPKDLIDALIRPASMTLTDDGQARLVISDVLSIERAAQIMKLLSEKEPLTDL